MSHNAKKKNSKNTEEKEEDLIVDKKFKRFFLKRNRDISGVSGVGYVAEGIQFADGTCVIKWNTNTPSTSIFHSVVEMEHVHGHEGSTIICWID